MDQVALGLQLARPPEIIRRDRRRTERIVAVHQFVGTNDFSVFERKRVERSHELRDGMMRGVASCARLHRRANCAHACRSSALRLPTSARQVSGVSAAPSTRGPYATTASRRLPKTLRKSATSESAAVFHVGVMERLYVSGLWAFGSCLWSTGGSWFRFHDQSQGPQSQEPRAERRTMTPCDSAS